jgi:hypothetical protein
MPIAETVRRPIGVVAVGEVDEPGFDGEEWIVSFEVTLGRRLRSV